MENTTIKHDRECLSCDKMFKCAGSEKFPCLLKEERKDGKRGFERGGVESTSRKVRK